MKTPTNPPVPWGQIVPVVQELQDLIREVIEDQDDGVQLPMRVERAAVRSYPETRRDHFTRVYEAVEEYLSSAFPVTRYRNWVSLAIVENFPQAFYAGYAEASGGDTVEADDDKWLTAAMNDHLEYVTSLFDHLKDLRKGGTFEADSVADQHASAYAVTLDSIYGRGKLLGAPNKMLTFARDPDFPPSEEPCKQCLRYEGQRHRAKWWMKKDLVRRNGNENFDCGRWGPCHHYLYTDQGELWSV